MLDLQHRFGVRVQLRKARRIVFRQLTPDHVAYDLVLVDVPVGIVQRDDLLSVPQHRDAIREALNLLEPVGDEDDPDALPAQQLHDGEQGLRFVLRQHRRGLVHHQDTAVVAQRLCDLDQLLLGHGDAAHRGGDIHVLQLQPFEDLARLGVHLLPVQPGKPSPAPLKLLPEEDVLRHGQRWHEVELLVDDADAQRHGLAGPGNADGLSVYGNLTLIGAVHAAQDLDQRGLSRAVFADQGMDFAL